MAYKDRYDCTSRICKRSLVEQLKSNKHRGHTWSNDQCFGDSSCGAAMLLGVSIMHRWHASWRIRAVEGPIEALVEGLRMGAHEVCHTAILCLVGLIPPPASQRSLNEQGSLIINVILLQARSISFAFGNLAGKNKTGHQAHL